MIFSGILLIFYLIFFFVISCKDSSGSESKSRCKKSFDKRTQINSFQNNNKLGGKDERGNHNQPNDCGGNGNENNNEEDKDEKGKGEEDKNEEDNYALPNDHKSNDISSLDKNNREIQCNNKVDIHKDKLDFYCKICLKDIDMKTKHCQQCNKCIIEFQCHNPWYNVCIGKSNKNLFITLTVFSLLFTLSKILIIIYFFITKGLSKLETFKIGILFTDLILSITTFITIIDGFIFNIYIWMKGMKIYEYIEKKNQEKKNKKEFLLNEIKGKINLEEIRRKKLEEEKIYENEIHKENESENLDFDDGVKINLENDDDDDEGNEDNDKDVESNDGWIQKSNNNYKFPQLIINSPQNSCNEKKNLNQSKVDKEIKKESNKHNYKENENSKKLQSKLKIKILR